MTEIAGPVGHVNFVTSHTHPIRGYCVLEPAISVTQRLSTAGLCRPKDRNSMVVMLAKVVARDESVSASGFPFPRIRKERQADSSWRLICETDEADESTYNYEWWQVSEGDCALIARSPHVTVEADPSTLFFFCVVSSTQSSSPSVRVSDLVEIGGGKLIAIE